MPTKGKGGEPTDAQIAKVRRDVRRLSGADDDSLFSVGAADISGKWARDPNYDGIYVRVKSVYDNRCTVLREQTYHVACEGGDLTKPVERVKRAMRLEQNRRERENLEDLARAAAEKIDDRIRVGRHGSYSITLHGSLDSLRAALVAFDKAEKKSV
jgi:hypothetical protein